MSFDVTPPEGPEGPGRPRASTTPATPATSGSFADVLEVETARQRSVVPSVPQEVWDEVDAAARLWEELQAEGRQLRFEAPEAPGERVVVSLCDLEGRQVRRIGLTEAVGAAETLTSMHARESTGGRPSGT